VKIVAMAKKVMGQVQKNAVMELDSPNLQSSCARQLGYIQLYGIQN
jgi:hypothetical protein